MSNKKPTSQQRITDYNDEPIAFYLSMKDLSKKMSAQDCMSKCCDALLQVEPKSTTRQALMDEYVEAQRCVINRLGLNEAIVKMFDDYFMSPTLKPIKLNQLVRDSSFASRMNVLGASYRKPVHQSDGEYFAQRYKMDRRYPMDANNKCVDEVLVNVSGLKRFDMKTGMCVPAETQRYVLDVYDGILTYTDDLKSVTVSFIRKTPAPSEGFKSGIYTTIAALQQLEHMQQVRKEFGVK